MQAENAPRLSVSVDYQCLTQSEQRLNGSFSLTMGFNPDATFSQVFNRLTAVIRRELEADAVAVQTIQLTSVVMTVGSSFTAE